MEDVKESALVDALKSGKVAAAGLDVYEQSHSKIAISYFGKFEFDPHLGASTTKPKKA